MLDAGIRIRDMIVSVSAGFLMQFQRTPVLDLDFTEEKKSSGVIVLGYLP